MFLSARKKNVRSFIFYGVRRYSLKWMMCMALLLMATRPVLADSEKIPDLLGNWTDLKLVMTR